MFQRRIVIVSGLGTTGRRVFERLRTRSVDAVAASRSTRPAFDWHDRSTWVAALHGATAAYVTYPPGLGSRSAADDIGTLAGIAADMGVEHVVLLSIRGKRRALRAEQRLRGAPLDHTILRAAQLCGSHPDAVADLAVAALCDPAHLNRTYEIAHRGDGLMLGDPDGSRQRRDGRIAGLAVTAPSPGVAAVDSAASHSS